MDDTLFNTLFVADESAASDMSEKTAWPAYPGENPPKADKIRWLTRWESDARTAGYSAHLSDVKTLSRSPSWLTGL